MGLPTFDGPKVPAEIFPAVNAISVCQGKSVHGSYW